MQDQRERKETTITLDGSKMLTALRSRSLSAASFAELAHLSPNTLTRALTGQPISTQSARKIAETLTRTAVIEGLPELLAS